MLYELVASVTV